MDKEIYNFLFNRDPFIELIAIIYIIINLLLPIVLFISMFKINKRLKRLDNVMDDILDRIDKSNMELEEIRIKTRS